LLVSLWFRRSYERVLQRDTNVGTGTLVAWSTICPGWGMWSGADGVADVDAEL
jgi:hypothetical protein